MAWSDFFLPSGAQTADEQQANLDRQKQQYEDALARRQAAGTISVQDLAKDQEYVTGVQLDSQNAAAAQGFVEGAQEGFQNVLAAPGKVVGFAGDTAGTLLGGILKNIPWWVYLAAVALTLAGTSLAATVLTRMTDDGFRTWSRRVTLGVSVTYIARGLWLVAVP